MQHDFALSAKDSSQVKMKELLLTRLISFYPYLPKKAILSIVNAMGQNHYPSGHQFLQKAALTLKTALRNANPQSKRALIQNLFVNECVKGQAIRNSVTRTLGFEVPVLLVISPTMRCPLHCYGCYSAQYSRSKDLEYQIVDNLITEAKSMGVYFFVISGGEPFVYPGIYDLFRKHNDAFFMVYTSGITMANGNVDELVSLGNVLPCISVEGFEEETDKRRGEGHFKKVLNTFGHLRNNGIPFGFSATATRLNSELILKDEFVKFYADQGASLGWYFQYMPIGRNPDLDLVPTPKQRNDRLYRILEFRKNYDILLADFWNDGPVVGGCLAGSRRYLHINSSGDIEPCVFCQFATDNLHNTTLLNALKTSPLFKAIRKRQPYDENLLMPCMIIDNPHILKEIIQEVNPYETCSGGAKRLVTDLYPKLQAYASEYKELAGKSWEDLFKEQYKKVTDQEKQASEYFRTGEVEKPSETISSKTIN